jgi:hypothetical protein
MLEFICCPDAGNLDGLAHLPGALHSAAHASVMHHVQKKNQVEKQFFPWKSSEGPDYL